MTRRTISCEVARRIAVRAQLLHGGAVGDLDDVVARLGFLQLDPTAVIAPSADLIAFTRLGSGYQTGAVQRGADTDRRFFELLDQPSPKEPAIAMARPMADLPLFLGAMFKRRTTPGRATDWLAANDGFRVRVLDQLRDSGPLASRDIQDTSAVSWASTGWKNDQNVTQMLEFLAARGYVAIAGRQGKQRLWDVAERVFPANLLDAAVPVDDARRIIEQRRLTALGIVKPPVVEVGEVVEVEGTAGTWRLDPDALDALAVGGFPGRTALLSPFDRLTHHRGRAAELFGFEYVLEMYKPKDKRRWGYFALPILHGDQLVGKLDAAADRSAGALVVHHVHEDVPFDAAIRDGVAGELGSLAEWLGLGEVRLP